MTLKGGPPRSIFLQELSKLSAGPSVFLSGRGNLLLSGAFVAASLDTIFLRILHFRHDFPRLATGIVMVRVRGRLLLRTTFPA